VNTLSMITQARGYKLPYLIVPTMFDRRTKAARDSLITLKETYPYNLWDDIIPVDTQFRDASKIGLPLTLVNPTSRGAKAYRLLLTSLLRKTHEDELIAEKAKTEVV